MRRTLHGLVALILALSTRADATVVRPVRIDEAIAAASEVFVGTVVSQRVVEGGPPRNLLFTEVTFGRLTIVKGSRAPKTLTYRFAGGTRGGTNGTGN